MFAGKTKELINIVKRAELAGLNVKVFKPAIDTRWGTDHIRSHSGDDHDATPINSPIDLLDYLDSDTVLVAIDEIQFFDDSIIDVVKFLLEQDIKVVFAGLSLDFRGEPFGSMPELLALCDELERPTAVCLYINKSGQKCGQAATRTQRLINGEPANYTDPIVMIGADEAYDARCVNHHFVPGKPELNLKKSQSK